MVSIPTIKELQDSVLADLEAEFGVNVPLFGQNFLRALSAVQASKLKLFYLAIALVQKNIFVDTADPASIGGTLERFGVVKLKRLPFPATAGVYTITVTGDIGGTIPAQTTFKSADESTSPGKLYILDEAFVLTAPIDVITLRALESGLDGRLSVGDTVTSTAPIANVDSIAIVAGETTAPQAAEDIEDYRQKAIDAYQLEAQGGAGGDYRIWSFDAQGVQRVYPYSKSGGDSEVDLFVEATIADSTDGKGTPSQAILDAVEEVVERDPDTTKPINDRGRRPINVIVDFIPVTIKTVDIEISGYVGLNATKETAIEAGIVEDVSGIRPFVASADVLADKNDILDNNRIIAAILTAVPGSVFGAITIKVNAVVFNTFTFENGDIPFIEDANVTFL